MPMWARAIIFGVELVGFLLLCIFATIKFYKDNCKEGKKVAKKNLEDDLIYFSINFAIILALFLFTFPSYVFLSYNKLILVSTVVLTSILIILVALIEYIYVRAISFALTVAMIISTFIITVGGAIKVIDYKDEVIISEKTSTKTITPTMFSEKYIGFTDDAAGNIKTYLFYYKDNDVWKYKEIEAADVKTVRIKDEDVYVEKIITETLYYSKEKEILQKIIYTQKKTKSIQSI